VKNEVASSDITLVTFRIKTSQATFYRRMTNNFYENGIIPPPTLKNMFQHYGSQPYAKFEEIACERSRRNVHRQGILPFRHSSGIHGTEA
jgi:hypothetical protein